MGASLLTRDISVPLSILLKESADLKFRIDHSESGWIIVSGNQLQKINSIRQDLKNLEKVILLDPGESFSRDEIYMGKVKEMGTGFMRYSGLSGLSKFHPYGINMCWR